ncbi:MAG TPA: glycosyltransferase [Kiritimatiellia bacterium]|nr:glycosyltransferase [Kiritimatiellia bacterium]
MTRPRIAFWFRYGPAEHAELFHALPELIADLARHADVHYFGMKSEKKLPDLIQRHATVHLLPFTVRRTSNRDKLLKTLLWILWLPRVARTCRNLGIHAVYIDETIPFTASIARRWFGPRTAITVADFFVDIYLAPHRPLRPLARWIRRFDLNSWRHLPLIFTRARATRDYLATQGIDPHRVLPVYDPCDTTVYKPLDKTQCRQTFNFSPDTIVLVHHGILHPNKANDRILRAFARLLPHHPRLHYLLVGDGPDKPHLERLIRELGLQNHVTLTGWLPTLADVNRALNAGDIGLVMRAGHQSDNFHMTGALVHAMAVGLPILAARLGGISEAVRPDHNGLLFDPICEEEFDQALLRLAHSPDLRARLGTNALQDAQQLFSMESVIQRTNTALLDLAAGKDPSHDS